MSATSGTFLSAMSLGLFVAVPIGPVGVLCITRSLSSGAVCGLLTGLGAASVHAGWVFVATLDLKPMSAALARPEVAWVLPCLAAAILFVHGLRGLGARRPPVASKASKASSSHFASYGSGAALALANPVTIVLFIAVIPPLEGSARLAWAVGTFAGSAGWWLVLSSTIASFRARVSDVWILWTHRISGITLIVIAALLLIR